MEMPQSPVLRLRPRATKRYETFRGHSCLTLATLVSLFATVYMHTQPRASQLNHYTNRHHYGLGSPLPQWVCE
jgi:hypothetical protein